ncbi:MAG: peptide chain release factor N(5)-glutamine methyltransferase [Pseudomonadota bacterium]
MASEISHWTTEQLLSWAASDFQSKGMSDARLAAELLLSRVLGTDRVGLFMRYDRPVNEAERKQFRSYVEQRRAGKPVAYILGRKEFYSLSFKVDPSVLIPRPETEILVDEILDYVRERRMEAVKICDVGTGSGAIAIALKKQLPNASVTGVDVSREALETARENAATHSVEIEWIESDLMAGLAGPWDVVAANLPYIPAEGYEGLPVDIRNYEPRIALDGGRGGLAKIANLVLQAADKIGSGALFLEIGLGQRDEVVRLLAESGFRSDRVRSDLAGIPRVIRALRESGEGRGVG